MKILQGDVWKRRGVSLLWGGETLSVLAQPQDVVSIRQFFAIVGKWPDDLPCNDGNTLVVAGLEGCVDLMDPIEAEAWMKSDLLPAVLAFQDEYSLEAALVSTGRRPGTGGSGTLLTGLGFGGTRGRLGGRHRTRAPRYDRPAWSPCRCRRWSCCRWPRRCESARSR